MDCVFGLGDGDLVLSLASRGRRVIACLIGDETDPEPALRARLEAHREKVEVCRLRHARDVRQLVYEVYPDMLSVLDMVHLAVHGKHPIGDQALEVLRRKMIDEFFHVAMTLPTRFGNSPIDALVGACRMFENLEWWLPAPSPKALRVGDRPIVAVGAGPSLGTHAAALRDIQDRVTIIAADSACAALAEAGIAYDLVCSLERSQVTSRKLAAVEDHGDAILACLPYIPADAARGFDRICRVSHEDALFIWSETDQDAVIYTGATSGVMTVGLAEFLSRGREHPIYLVGHDCAFADATHAPGAVYDERAAADDELWVQGNDGRVRTTNYLLHAGLAIERVAASTETKIINVAAAGPRPTGMRIGRTFDGALPERLEIPPCGDAVRLSREQDQDMEGRRERVLRRLRQLHIDVEVAAARFAQRQDLQDYHVAGLPGGNQAILAYLLRPMLTQASIEAKMGRDLRSIQAMLRQRMANWTEEVAPALLEARDRAVAAADEKPGRVAC